MKYLLDTNIVSEPLRPKPSNSIMRRLREHEDEIAIPAPVWHELRFGCLRLSRSRRREVIERYIECVVLASFPVLEYDQRAADWHAIERARLSRGGQDPTVRRWADRRCRLRQRPNSGYVELRATSGGSTVYKFKVGRELGSGYPKITDPLPPPT